MNGIQTTTTVEKFFTKQGASRVVQARLVLRDDGEWVVTLNQGSGENRDFYLSFTSAEDLKAWRSALALAEELVCEHRAARPSTAGGAKDE